MKIKRNKYLPFYKINQVDVYQASSIKKSIPKQFERDMNINEIFFDRWQIKNTDDLLSLAS
jgi:hypothetical protein